MVQKGGSFECMNYAFKLHVSIIKLFVTNATFKNTPIFDELMKQICSNHFYLLQLLILEKQD